VKFEICIDVDDVERAVKFYGQGLGLTVLERHLDWAQLTLNEQTVWLMKVAAGPDGRLTRDYGRHWTPIHLDFLNQTTGHWYRMAHGEKTLAVRAERSRASGEVEAQAGRACGGLRLRCATLRPNGDGLNRQ
jgi:catechol 2,3-dioxygenase-like lactoylglutathione lyase family enzyme